jgi:hypothetical protein
MGNAGVVQAVRFSWDATASEILSVYRELASTPQANLQGNGVETAGLHRTADDV